MLTLKNIIQTAVINYACILTLDPEKILNECQTLGVSASSFAGVMSYETFASATEIKRPIVVENELDYLNYLDEHPCVEADYIIFSRR